MSVYVYMYIQKEKKYTNAIILRLDGRWCQNFHCHDMRQGQKQKTKKKNSFCDSHYTMSAQNHTMLCLLSWLISQIWSITSVMQIMTSILNEMLMINWFWYIQSDGCKVLYSFYRDVLGCRFGIGETVVTAPLCDPTYSGFKAAPIPRHQSGSQGLQVSALQWSEV